MENFSNLILILENRTLDVVLSRHLFSEIKNLLKDIVIDFLFQSQRLLHRISVAITLANQKFWYPGNRFLKIK